MNNIDNILIESGRSVDALLENTINRLSEIKKCIITEKERYQDIQMLCNKYTDFDNVKIVQIDSMSEMFEQILRVKKNDVKEVVAALFTFNKNGEKE